MMPNNKNQHFVPRCHLKPFTLGGDGRAINLYNLKAEKFIGDAPVKSQCSRNYFYGQDLALEKTFSVMEGFYAGAIKKLINDENMTADDLYVLKSFAFLQYMRTEENIKRALEQAEQFNDVVSKGAKCPVSEELLFETAHESLIVMVIKSFVDMLPMLDDLKICIFVNRSDEDFITSDDPSFFTSRFHVQKLGVKNFGFGSAGALLFLPLTPRHLLMCYDGDVYTVPDKKGHFVNIKKNDVIALNQLQLIKASRNIYFLNSGHLQKIVTQYTRAKSLRPDRWVGIKTFIRVSNTDSGETYKEDDGTHSAIKDADGTTSEMIVSSAYHPAPDVWVSKLKYRNPLKYFYNGSGRGYMRLAVHKKEAEMSLTNIGIAPP